LLVTRGWYNLKLYDSYLNEGIDRSVLEEVNEKSKLDWIMARAGDLGLIGIDDIQVVIYYISDRSDMVYVIADGNIAEYSVGVYLPDGGLVKEVDADTIKGALEGFSRLMKQYK